MTARHSIADHADLVHRPEDGKRAPLEVGAWAVFEQGHELVPALHLVRIVDGPTYVKDEDERAVEELWRCDDGQERSRWCLTRVFVEETAIDARAAVPCVLAGEAFDRRAMDTLMLRALRICELAERRPRGDWPDLEQLARASAELAAALNARHRFAHVALPNLARNLYSASVLAVAAEDPAILHGGVPHARAAELCDLIARRTT